MKRLILAPHADDEVLGCGGLLAKYPDDCVVVICAEQTETRLEESRAAQKILKYSKAYRLGLPDGRLPMHEVEMVTMLDELLSVEQPDEMYLPYPDLHQDHIAAYEAGMRAARASMKPNHWYVPNVFVYDVAAYSLELRPTGLRYSVFEDISGWPVSAKGHAMDAYASECAPPPSPSNGRALAMQAQALGAMHKIEAAEQYAVVRMVR